MARSRAGFGEDPAARGADLAAGYRQYSPYFDRPWVARQIEPYGSLNQNLDTYRGKQDMALYDLSAGAVLKKAGLTGKQPAPTPTPNPTPNPTPPANPKPPRTPKPKKPKVPKVPKKPKGRVSNTPGTAKPKPKSPYGSGPGGPAPELKAPKKPVAKKAPKKPKVPKQATRVPNAY